MQQDVWVKSSYSNATGNCVELNQSTQAVLVRDSKVTDGPILDFGPSAVVTFIESVVKV